MAIDADVNYPGGFKLQIEIVLKIPATSMMVSVTIAATLVSLSGRVCCCLLAGSIGFDWSDVDCFISRHALL